jgi:WhiB family transcriptional regulator, redox-sensing transcriptional regulator
MTPSSRRLMSGRPVDRQPPSVALAEGGRWQQSARCRGLPSKVFFPEELDSRRQRRLQEQAAKQICASCPVIVACREHALRAPEKYGVWGALTARERFTRW